MCSERMSKLHSHVSEPSEADYSDFLSFGDSPLAHWRISGDSSAEERRGPGEIEVRRYAQHKSFIHNNALGISAVGNTSQVLIRSIEGISRIGAKLFETCLALGAGAIGIYEAAHGGEISGLKFETADPTLVTRPTISCPVTQG